MLLEQFGGSNGELAAAMQYTIQGFNTDDPKLKDVLMDIGTEELSHLEVIGTLARAHLQTSVKHRRAAEADPLLAITGGGGVNLYNAQGSAWTADYLKVSGQPEVDLRNNIAAEARTKITYDRLMAFTDDPGTLDALQFLMTREITHMKAFMVSLEGLGKRPLEVGSVPPTPGLVDQYFNGSTGSGPNGAVDVSDQWAPGAGYEVVENPTFNPQDMEVDGPSGMRRLKKNMTD